MAPNRRIQPEPENQSRAAGPPAPASAAATAPRPAPEPPVSESPRVQTEPVSAFEAVVDHELVAVDDHVSADAEVAGAAAATEGEDLHEAIARIRQIRRPLGTFTQKLALPERAGYKRHWFNDHAGRVAEAEANGWAYVLDTDKKPIKRCVGSGRDKGALYAYAMEIPAVFWEEDMAARHQDAQGRIDALKAGPFRAPQGAAKAADQGKFYDPTPETGAGPLQIVRPGQQT